MRRSRLLACATLSLTLIAFSGCKEDSTGPPAGLAIEDFMDAAGEGLESIASALQENQASVTLEVLGFYISNITSQPALSASPASMRIPGAALGGTFYWDTQQFGYVLDDAATGAPADGVRFLLYTVDESTYLPTIPLDQIGHIDIRDLSSGDNVDVRHEVVIGGATVLSFSVTGPVTQTSADLTTSGTVSDGMLSANFDFGVEASQAGLNLSMDVTSGTYRLLWDYARGLYGYGPGSDLITLSESQSGGKVELIVNFDAQDLVTGGSVVEFSDVVVADVAGSSGFIEVTPRSESGLTELDGFELAEGYYQLFELQYYMIQLTVFGVQNSGRQVPIS